MNLQQLRYYVELSKYKSISEAANSLYITQQGLSTSMSRLEAELSCKLFVRTSYGLQFTEQGEFFLEHAKAILEHYDICKATFENENQNKQTLSIAAATGTLVEFGNLCIQQYTAAFPNCKINVMSTTHRDCECLLDSGEVDLGFAVEEVDLSKYDYYRLFSSPAAIVMRRDNPLASMSAIPLSALDNVPMVLMDETSKVSEHFISLMDEQNLNLNIQFRVGEMLNIFRIVRDSPWVGLTNATIAEELNFPEIVAIPLDDVRCSWCAGIIKRKEGPTPPLALDFFNYFHRNIPHKGIVSLSQDELN